MARDKVEDPVLMPNLGLYLDRPPVAMEPRMLSEVWNVRIKEGQIRRENMGWAKFPNSTSPLNLDGRPALLVTNFFPSQGGQLLIFGTDRDLYEWDPVNELVEYLTPRYETGTADATNGSKTVTGTNTVWTSNLKTGDRIHIGASGQRSQSAKWYEIDTVDSDTQLTLTTAYEEATVSGADYTARQVFTGDTQNYWRSVTFPRAGGTLGGDQNQPDRMYFTNGVDSIVAWDSASDQVYFPDLGNVSAAGTIARFKNMLMLGDIVTDNGDRKPYSARNSAIGEPENHTTGEAAEYVVHDGVDPILEMATLGDVLVIYAERSVNLASFVGDPIIFAFRSAINGIGPIAGRAVADYGDLHVFLGPDAQYEFDGTNIREAGYHVWRDVLRKHSPQRVDAFLSHFDEENGEVLWVVPLNSDPDTASGAPQNAYVEHYLEMVGDEHPTPVTFRYLPATCFGYYQREKTLTWDSVEGTWDEQNYRWNDRFLQAAFPWNLFGDEDGNILILGERDSYAGESFASYARTGRIPIGSTRRKATIRRIYPFVEQLPAATYPLEVYLHLAEQADGPTEESGPFNFDLTQSGNHFVSPRRTGRYLELEFRTAGAGSAFSLAGWQIERVPAGER